MSVSTTRLFLLFFFFCFWSRPMWLCVWLNFYQLIRRFLLRLSVNAMQLLAPWRYPSAGQCESGPKCYRRRLVRCRLVRMSVTVRSNFWFPGGASTLDSTNRNPVILMVTFKRLSLQARSVCDITMNWASTYPANPSLSVWQSHHTILFYSSINQW